MDNDLYLRFVEDNEIKCKYSRNREENRYAETTQFQIAHDGELR